MLYPDGLVELNNIDHLVDITKKVSNPNHQIPKDNIFTSEKMAQQTIDLYHQLLSTPS